MDRWRSRKVLHSEKNSKIQETASFSASLRYALRAYAMGITRAHHGENPNQNLSFTNESLNRSINSPLRPRAARILVIFRSKTSREPPFPSARDRKGSSRDGARLALGNVANLCYTASRVIFPSDAIHFRAKRKVWRNLQQPDSPESSRESVWVALLFHSQSLQFPRQALQKLKAILVCEHSDTMLSTHSGGRTCSSVSASR